jgi:hypothetical protein
VGLINSVISGERMKNLQGCVDCACEKGSVTCPKCLGESVNWGSCGLCHETGVVPCECECHVDWKGEKEQHDIDEMLGK